MTLPNIALFGYAGAGKDTVAEYLVKHHAYTRIAFADPLKEMTLSINPLMDSACCHGCEFDHAADDDYCLADAVREQGWEAAKRNNPEVRRFLRALGKTMRDQDPDYWLDIAMNKILSADGWHMPVVVTDVRYENEFNCLSANAFTTVRIDRPGHDTSDVDPESGRLIESVTPDWTIRNDTTIDFLNKRVDFIVKKHTT